jgi:Protein of unknown function (DUF1761)
LHYHFFKFLNKSKNMGNINIWAVLVAAIASFVVGGLWYSPLLFAKVWMQANGFTEEDLKKNNMARAFGFSFLFALIMSANLAMFLDDPKTDVVWGMTAGALAGVGWVAMGFATVALFENRSWTYILVNTGYQIITLVLMGAILGAWR